MSLDHIAIKKLGWKHKTNLFVINVPANFLDSIARDTLDELFCEEFIAHCKLILYHESKI